MKKNRISLTDFISIVFSWKKLLIINLFIITTIVTIISFLIPEKFKATATLTVQDQSGSTGVLSGMLSNVGSVLGGALFGSSGTDVDKIFGYLESRTVFLEVINKFNLTEYYDITQNPRDLTLKRLRDDVVFDLTQNGLISVSMIHKDPVKSKEIVEYFIYKSDSLNRAISTISARDYRLYVEKRYDRNLKELKEAELKLKEFQKRTGIYVVPEQFEIVFKFISELEAELAKKQLEAQIIKKKLGASSPSYETAEISADLLKEKINKLLSGESSTNSSIISFPFDDIPDIQMEYLQLYREVEIQSKLLEFTLPIYEQALMEEQKNIPSIIVIDYPLIPQMKDSPKKAFIILGFFIIALFSHVIFILRGEISQVREDHTNIYEEKEFQFFNKIKKIYKIN